MAKRVFKADLSISGIEKLKKDLINYRDKTLKHRCDMLAKELADQGVSIAQANVASLDAVFTGELISSIHTGFGGTTKDTAIFYVVADSDHAVFVEFGTGSKGEANPYPYLLPDGVEWNYNSGETIFQTASGSYGWFYPTDDGRWMFTEGMPSRPFMYETSLELQQIVEETAKRVFNL